MTTSRSEKAAAHRLADLGGAPYQASLTTVRVLSDIASVLDIGDLRSFVSTPAAGHVLPLPTEQDNIEVLEDLVGRFELGPEPAIVAPAFGNSSRLLVPFRVGGATVWADLAMVDSFRPSGAWSIDVAQLAPALSDVAADSTLTVRGHRAVQIDLPPEQGGDAWLAPPLVTVEPQWRSPGPGFEWVGVSFESIGQVRESDDHDYGACKRPWNCGYSHEWPAIDPDRKGLVVPAPLLACYQQLADWEIAEPQESRETLGRLAADRSCWIGLDLPSWVTLWIKVPPHDRELAAPDSRRAGGW